MLSPSHIWLDTCSLVWLTSLRPLQKNTERRTTVLMTPADIGETFIKTLVLGLAIYGLYELVKGAYQDWKKNRKDENDEH
jgi:hypothetical protein